MAHTLGKLDRFAYLRPELFHVDSSGRSREEFVRHNKTRDGLPLAIWVAGEVWDFGTLSTLFSGMGEVEQDVIANQYVAGNGRVFASWLRSLN